jgi:hypothetical protein
MINFLNKNDKLNENKNSLSITYPRTVNIIYGNYPYPDVIHNFILDIKNNLEPSMENYTNVKGGMTSWNHYVENDNFKDFFAYLINKHQTSHPQIFQYFLEKNIVADAWGNEIKKGDRLQYHSHSCWHGILYLTKGCNLILPELNLQITPEPGNYYVFPPEILHGFDENNDDNKRYSLIFNIKQRPDIFNFDKKYERKNS